MSNPPARRPGQWRLLWLLLLGALALGAGLGLREPSPPDEPRFVLAAQRMVDSGQWLIPYRGSEIYAHKPPPFMWLQAGAWLLVRDWSIAFLLPSLLAALGTLWLVHDLAARLWHRRAGLPAGLALLACLQFGLQAKRGQIDMVLVFWTTLAMWGLLRHLLRGPDWSALALAGFAAGIGTITKGVGFLPLLALLPWWLARWRTRSHMQAPHTMTSGMRSSDTALSNMKSSNTMLRGTTSLPPVVSWQSMPAANWRWSWLPLGFLLGIAIWLLPLLVTVLGSDDPALHRYAQELLFKQTGTRYAAAWHHVQPPWYYLQVIATLWLPGALLLPWLLPAWWRRMRRGDARVIVLLGWAALVLLFFSASPGKREVYLFPALPLLCVAAAPLLTGLLRRRGVRRVLLGYVIGSASLALVLAGSGLLDASWAVGLAESRAIDSAAMHRLLRWLLVIGGGGWLLVIGCRQARAGAAAVGFAWLLWTVYGIGLAPALNASSSARGLMQRADARIGADAELGLVGWREQHRLQALRTPVDFGFERDPAAQWRDAAHWVAQAPQRRWLFVLKEAVGPCVDRRQLIDLGRSSRRDWLLVPGAAWIEDCTPP